MEFRIADTFTDSLARLTGDEQKAVKTTAFDLQVNPTTPGMRQLAKAGGPVNHPNAAPKGNGNGSALPQSPAQSAATASRSRYADL